MCNVLVVLEAVLVVLEVVLQPLLLQLLLLQLLLLIPWGEKVPRPFFVGVPLFPARDNRGSTLSGIIIRVHLCWNFGRLVLGTLGSHRYQTKTHGSHHLCALFGHKISSN